MMESCCNCGEKMDADEMILVHDEFVCPGCEDELVPCRHCRRAPCDCDRQYDEWKDRQLDDYEDRNYHDDW